MSLLFSVRSNLSADPLLNERMESNTNWKYRYFDSMYIAFIKLFLLQSADEPQVGHCHAVIRLISDPYVVLTFSKYYFTGIGMQLLLRLELHHFQPRRLSNSVNLLDIENEL